MIRRIVFGLLIACLTIGQCAATNTIFGASSSVELLDESTFNQAIGNVTETTLVMFYTPKSGKSKSAAPELNKLVNSMNGMIRVTAVDCIENESLCEAEQVYHEETIPVIKVYSGGSAKRYVASDITAKQLVTFAFNTMSSHSSQLTASPRLTQRPRIILFTDKQDIPNMWKALSQRFHQSIDFYFARQSDKKLVKQFKVDSFPRVIAEPIGSNEQQVYDGPMSFKSLIEWTRQFHNVDATVSNQLKLPELVDQSCLEMYCLNGKASLCAILIASHSSPNFAKQVDTFAQIELLRSDPVFTHVTLDSDKQQSFIQHAFGLSPADYPQIVVLSVKRERFAPFVGAFETDGVSSWLRGVTSGQIRTSPLESSSGKLPTLEGTDPDHPACVPPSTPSIPTEESSHSSQSHPGDRWIWPINAQNFTRDVLKSRAAWMILFMSNDNNEEMRQPWLDVANKTRHSVRMSVVNIDGEPEFAELFNITRDATPIVYSIRGTSTGKRTMKSFKPFDGDLTAEALNQHSLTLLDSNHIFRVRGEQGLNQFMAAPPIDASRVLLFTKHTSVIAPIFASLSLDYVGDLVFGVASHKDKELMEKFQVRQVPSLVAIGMLPVENGAMSLIAGNYESAFAYDPLHIWCDHIIQEGVVNERMPEEIREKYREHRKTLAQQAHRTAKDEL